MLYQFSFQNYKSYKNEAVLDYQAATVPEFSETLLGDDKGGWALPVGVIYGPNGGGKSNILQALSCLITTVVRPIHDLDKGRVTAIYQQRAQCEPFLFDEESADTPTRFEIYFRIKDNIYRYQLSLLHDEVIAEGLYWRAVGGKRTGTVYERDGSEITLGASISKAGVNRSVNPKMPFLSFLAINYDLPMINEVQIWFESCVIRNYGNPVTESNVFLPAILGTS